MFFQRISTEMVDRWCTLYIVFEFTDGETGFALAEIPDDGIHWGIVGAAVVMPVFLVSIFQKRKQRVVKKENAE